MSQPASPAPEAQVAQVPEGQAPEGQVPEGQAPENQSALKPSRPPSYVKLAMRNMVRKGSKSLFHFGLTTVGLVGLLVALAYLTR
ncbi:MAG: DUF3285 domain-containing protein [Elainella sp.]